jgi:hypothetical protein
VRNTSQHAVDTIVGFRVTGSTPELFNPVDGTIIPQALYTIQGSQTRVPLHLDPYGSAFVVFEQPAAVHVTQIEKDGQQAESVELIRNNRNEFVLPNAAEGTYRLKFSNGLESTTQVEAPSSVDLPASQWTIQFQADRGAPRGRIPLRDFESWTASPDAGMRYFSGTATYRTEFKVKRSPGERTFLTLTSLHEICTIHVNGMNAGTLWAMPYRMDITGKLRDGRNTVELEVTNLWPNRIIGDAQPSATRAYTHTNIRKYTADSPLLPSGLIGPVSLQIERPARVPLTPDTRHRH